MSGSNSGTQQSEFVWVMKFDGLGEVEARKMTGLTMELETMEYNEGGVNGHTHTLPGTTRHGTIRFENIFGVTSDIVQWALDTAKGVYKKRNGLLTVYEEYKGDAYRRVRFNDLLPTFYDGPDFFGVKDNTQFDAIEFDHAGFEIVSP